MFAGILSGGETGPGDGRLRWIRGGQPAVIALIAQGGEVRQLAFRQQSFEDIGGHPIHSQDDDAPGSRMFQVHENSTFRRHTEQQAGENDGCDPAGHTTPDDHDGAQEGQRSQEHEAEDRSQHGEQSAQAADQYVSAAGVNITEYGQVR
ncbi:MAG: hypothetical protein BWY76_01888 [bacterium ADurb.Bin429]|nr:MAG: hypothetical protein BWY76_01888 [bacterium ADurb.Bin429]